MNRFMDSNDLVKRFGRPERTQGKALVLQNTQQGAEAWPPGYPAPQLHDREPPVILREVQHDGSVLCLFPGEPVRRFSDREASDTGIRRFQETAPRRLAVRDLPPPVITPDAPDPLWQEKDAVRRLSPSWPPQPPWRV
jgi:hypothetical protein